MAKRNPAKTRSSKATAKPQVIVKTVRAKYDNAQTTHDNARHWAAADGLSAAAANAVAIRSILRKRSRYEVTNNGLANGIVSTWVNDIIATGARWQIASEFDSSRRLRKAFSRWADEIELPEKLQTMRRAQCVDGEAFAVFVTNERLMSPIKLDIMLVEADCVSDPALSAVVTKTHNDGITYDKMGHPTTYRVLRYHPGDVYFDASQSDYDEYPAESVIHLFRAERPGQLRGVPELTATLGLFAELRRYTLAVLAAAETAADFAWFLKTTSPTVEAANATPFDLVDVERRMGQVLPAHWDIGQLKAEQPTTTYGDFRRNIINEAARPLNMPYNVAACDSSAYNYASGRLDHQTYHRAVYIDRDHIAKRVLDRIAYAWLGEAALVPGLIDDGAPPFVDWDWQWQWDGFEHVDPVKEATAEATRLSQHTTTLRDVYDAQGTDWRDALSQRAAELDTMRQLGIPILTQSGAVVGADPSAGDQPNG